MAQQQFDRYQIIAELGQGGMATVYRAYDPRFRREVALKILPSAFLNDPAFHVRFEREAQSIAALEHPAIVPVYDFGEADGQPYLVMRLMTGGSLADRLEKTTLSLAEITRIFSRLAPALDAAHRHGIIHRDLKPANILFDQYDEPYLADFGIAKWASEGDATKALTGTGATVGTPAYMSPEQVQGQDLDGRSDVYALGVILFEMLTGKRPYEATTPMALAIKHVTDPVPTLATQNLPPTCQMVINRAMAKNPQERYGNAAALTHELASIATSSHPTPTRLAPTAAQTEVMHPTPPPRPATPPPTAPATPETAPARGRKPPIPALIGGGVLGLLLCLAGLIGLLFLLDVLPPGGDVTPTPADIAAATPTHNVNDEVAAPTATETPATLTIWYPSASGTAAEEALLQVIEKARVAFPNFNFVAEAIPFNELAPRWRQAVQQPNGPDILIHPGGFLQNPEDATLDMTDWVGNRADNLEISARESLQVNGRQLGLPLSSTVVVLYVNQTLMNTPPQTLDELLALVQNGQTLALWQTGYHLAGLFSAYGAELSNGTEACPNSEVALVAAMRYLVSLQEAGAIMAPDASAQQEAFRQGELQMFLDDSGMWADYAAALGDALHIYPVPPATSAFQPFNNPDGVYLNPNTPNPNTAVDVALFMVGLEAQEIFMNVGGAVPTNLGVALPDELRQNLQVAAASARSWPDNNILANDWVFVEGLLSAVLEEQRPPAIAVPAACALYQNVLNNSQ
ncbi:MAG: serine/threonine-protein kinase [Candidatus Promineifilaceae bacterium]